jgi:hypothetical protein
MSILFLCRILFGNLADVTVNIAMIANYRLKD